MCFCRRPATFFPTRKKLGTALDHGHWECRRPDSDRSRCNFFEWEADRRQWPTAEIDAMLVPMPAGMSIPEVLVQPTAQTPTEHLETGDPGLPGLLRAVQRLAASSPQEIRDAARELLTRGLNPVEPGIQSQVARLLETAWEVTNPEPAQPEPDAA
jgi:hypothetical protein